MSIVPFRSVNVWFIYLGTPMLYTYVFTLFIYPCVLTILSLYSVSLFPLDIFDIKIYLVWYEYSYFCYLLLTICIELSFSFTFILFLYLNWMWLCCRHHLAVFFLVFKNPLGYYLLVGEFNTFIYKVALYIFLPFAIFCVSHLLLILYWDVLIICVCVCVCVCVCFKIFSL